MPAPARKTDPVKARRSGIARGRRGVDPSGGTVECQALTSGHTFGRRSSADRAATSPASPSGLAYGRQPGLCGSVVVRSSSAGCSSAERPPPRRCPDPPRARACRPGAWCRPSSWRSWPRGRSWKPSPGSSFLPLRLRSRRARSSAVGCLENRSPGPSAASIAPVTLARVGPHDVAQRRVGLHGRGIHPDALALHQTRLGRSAPGPSRALPCGLHGAGARGSVTARNGPAPALPASQQELPSDRESERPPLQPVRSESMASK